MTKFLLRGRLEQYEFFQVVVCLSDQRYEAEAQATRYVEANGGTVLSFDDDETSFVSRGDVPDGFQNGARLDLGVFGASGRSLFTPGT